MDEDTKATNKESQPFKRPPVSAVNIGEVDAKRDAQNPNHNRKKRKPLSVFECWTIGLAIVGILVAGFTGGAIYWQAQIGAQTLGEIKKSGTDTHDLAVAAKTQADATAKLAAVQARIARPYVGIIASNVRQDKVAKQIPFMIVLKNFGGTPGTHFLGAWQIKVGETILKPDASYKQGPGIIFPGQEQSFPGTIIPAYFDDVVLGRKSFDIEIVVVYKGPDEEEYQYCVKQRYAANFDHFYVTATTGCTLTPK
jgi:hypothetical protein